MDFQTLQSWGTQPGDRQPEFDRQDGNNKTKHVGFSSLHSNERMISCSQTETSAVSAGTEVMPKMQINLIKATDEVIHDYWLSGGPNAIIRVHTAPRIELCDPQFTDCPVALDQLSGKRQTHLQMSSGTDDTMVNNYQMICDYWRNGVQSSPVNKWTGITVFEVSSHNDRPSQGAYPTTGALRQKQKKLDGHVVKPKWKHVEQHRDDCGDDLSSIQTTYYHDDLLDNNSYDLNPQ